MPHSPRPPAGLGNHLPPALRRCSRCAARYALLLALLAALAGLAPSRALTQNVQETKNAQDSLLQLAACFPAAKLAGPAPLASRIQAAPPCIIRHLVQENQADGIPLVPVPATPSPVFTRALQSILADLSAPLCAQLDTHLVGIYLVDDLGSSGFTEEFRNDAGRRLAFVALDKGVLLERPANQWSTWKESSSFLPAPGATLEMTIELPGNDTIESAVRFILLHELGHVLGYTSGAHPAVADVPAARFQDYPFIPLSWRKKDKRVRSRFDDFFPERRQLRFYGSTPKNLRLSQAPALYEKLLRTNFPSLYGSLSMHEDFAESFATYTHVVRGKRPWQVRAGAPDGRAVTVPSCFADGRCPDKKLFFDAFFQKP